MIPRLRRRRKRSSARFDLEYRFEAAARAVPAARRPWMLSWLRRFRRCPDRVFYIMDPSTGEWRPI
jgi:hypothetical protein